MAGEVGCQVAAGDLAWFAPARQVAAGDLAGWPPERVGGDLEGVAGTRDLRAQVGRGDAGEEHAPERGPDRRWRHGDARLCRDGLCRCIGLLAGETSLLDRKGCSIASGVHVFETREPAVLG